MTTTATRTPGVRCPQCGGFLIDVSDLIAGEVVSTCHGYIIRVRRDQGKS